jgi:hypothetical protein
LFLSLLVLSTSAHSRVHEFETTHLKSSGGTGVGGLYNEEAAFLNPAPLAFSTSAIVYAQRDTTKLTDNGVQQPKPKNLGFVMADGNPTLSGSLSYVTQEETIFKRKRWGLTFSSPVAERSAFGVSYRQTKDEDTSKHTIEKYYQTVFGVTHAIDDKTTLGIVAYDPFKSKAHETKAIVGVQYALMTYITANFDFGGDYTSDEISKTLLYRGSVQVKALDDFYLRFGGFNDKFHGEKGNGFGLAYLQPRLAFEVALKNTKRDSDLTLGTTERKYTETSFAASMRF